MFFTYKARRSFLERMMAAPGAGGGSASSGGTGAGSSGSSSDGSAASGSDTGTGTGSAGEGEGESSEGEGDADKPKLIHGMAPEVWNALTPSAREAIKDVSKYRRELRDAQGKLEQYEGKDKTEADKLAEEKKKVEAERQTLQAQRRNLNTTASFTAAGAVAGAKHPELLAAIAPLIAEIEWDDQDRPTNVDALIRGIKNKYPILFSATTVNGGEGTQKKPGATNDPKLFGQSRIQAAYSNSGKKKD